MTSRSPSVDYSACDISDKMLGQSNIPEARRRCGRAHEIALPRERFDFIFSLGVTTYQTSADLAATWRLIGDRLTAGGVAIISFTNRGSVDHVIRSALKLAKPLISRGVIGQSFGVHQYRLDEVESMARGAGLTIVRCVYLNQTFTPFNSLFPRPSVALAKLIERRAPRRALPALSADFLVFAKRA